MSDRDLANPSATPAPGSLGAASTAGAGPFDPDAPHDWAGEAEALEREAVARGAGLDAAALFVEAAHLREQHLGDPAAALGLVVRALEADPTYLPAVRATRRLASDLDDGTALSQALELEVRLTTGPSDRADLSLALARTLARLGLPEASQAALRRAEEASPGHFGVAEERAVRAAAAGDRPGLAEAWLACADAAAEPRLAADFLVAAAGLLEDALGDLERAGQAALRAYGLHGQDPVVRAAARRHAERLGQQEVLADILRADAVSASALDAGTTWLQLARVLAEGLDRPEEALQALERGHAAAPSDPLLLAELARVREQRGEWEEVSAALRDLAGAHLDRHDPAHLAEAVAAWLRRAEVEEERLGRTPEAIACCQAVLALMPGHRGALSTLGRLCARAGDWDGLLEAFVGEALAARDPRERAQKTYKAAEVLEERLSEPDRAIGLYREALSIDPALLAARVALERLHERQGHWQELVALLEADLGELETAPGLATRTLRLTLLQRRAELLEEHLDQPEQARAAWEAVQALAPGHLPALRALGRLHAQAGHWEALIGLFRAEADAAGDADAAAEQVLRIADLLDRRLGSADEAIAAYQEVLTLSPSHLPAMAAPSRLYRARGDHEGLVEVLRGEAAARAAPDERAAVLTEVGRLWEVELSEPAHAVESYQEALRASSGFPPACRALDRLYASLGRWTELAQLRREEVAGAVDQAPALLGLARLALDRDADSAAARKLAGEANAAAPGHPAPLLFDLRLEAAVPSRRGALRLALADAAPPEAAVALLLAAAADLPARARDAELLPRAAALAPERAVLAPVIDLMRAAGPPAEAARHAEARAGGAASGAERAHWLTRAAEAWARAGELRRAAEVAEAALHAQPTSVVALRAGWRLALQAGDLHRARELLRAEASALRHAPTASRAFLEAGRLSERLGDPSDAALDYRLAAELDPLAQAPLSGLEALQAGAGAEALLAARQARARAEREPARAADAWLSVARAALSGSGGVALARSALERALTARPGFTPALALRARLRAEAGEHAAALDDYLGAATAEADPVARLALHLAAATLAQDSLADLTRARHHLEAALQLAPEHREALARLARLHEGDGRPLLAADALRRLLSQGGLPPAEASAHHVALAWLEAQGGDATAALAHASRALALVPGHAEALRLVVELERRRDDPRALASALEAAAAAATDPALRADLRVESARLHAGPLRQRTRAVEQLRAALADAPARADARALLAAAYEESAPALAVDEHRRLLELDPLASESWLALYRLFERLRAHDRAYVAATVLRWMGAPLPGPTAERLLQEGDQQQLPSPPVLGDDEVATLRAPGDQGPLTELIAAAGDVLAEALRGAPLVAEPARDEHPVRRQLAELCRALGAGEAWALDPTAPGPLVLEPGERPVIRCGADQLRRATAREQRFLLGRLAARLRSRSALAEVVDEATLGDLLAAAVRQVVPDWSATGLPSEALVRQVGRALPRRVRKLLEPAARALAAGPDPDLPAWRAAAAGSADRAGLVLCGDVPTALDLLLRELPAGGPAVVAPARQAVRAHPRALALLAFAASEAHFTLRQRLRVAIA